jgi:hypothetical protein
LTLRRISLAHQGHYAVAVQNNAGSILSPPAFVRVIPFNDADGFWATTLATNQSNSLDGRDVAVDSSGNVYVTGAFGGTAHFGSQILISQGDNDVFISKSDAQGMVLWARRCGGPSYGENGNAIGVDSAGNVYVTGQFRDTANFGSYTLTSYGESDVFVAKLDPAGNFLWAINGGNDLYDYAQSLAVDPTGNAYVSGVIGYGTVPAQFGSFTVTNVGYQTLFVMKVNPSGQVLWAVQNGGDTVSSATPRGLAIGPMGDVYLAGVGYSTVTLGDTVLALAQNSASAFVTRLNDDGRFLWTQKLGQNSYSHDLGVDGAGHVYVYGAFSGAATFGSIALQSTPGYLSSSGSLPDNFLAKLDANGGFLWVRKGLGPAQYDSASIAVDHAGNAYLGMPFYNRLRVGNTTFESANYPDINLAKVDVQGRLIWTKQAGGDYFDFIGGMAIDAADNLYLMGLFQRETLFGETRLLANSDSGSSLFLVKMGSTPGPIITQQPQTQSVGAGETVTFSVQANGTAPLSYQWQKDGTDIPGAIGNSYLIARTQPTDEADYAVVVRNLGGMTTSASARLTVTTPPSVTIRLVTGLPQNTIAISWTPAQFILESAAELKGPWTQRNTPTNSLTLPAANGPQFFRTRRP